MVHMYRMFLLILFVFVSGTTHKLYFPTIKTDVECNPKAGIAWAGGENPTDVETLCVTWKHEWGIQRQGNDSIEYVNHIACPVYPFMAYGETVTLDYFDAMENKLGRDFNGYLLFLNEPDRKDQCYMSPYRAVFFYRAVREQYPNAIISMPQVSHFDYLNDWVWLREFYDILETKNIPYPDFATIHTYVKEDPNLIVDSMYSFLHERGLSKDKVWITEFGTNDPVIMREMLTLYQADNRIDRYAYYTVRYNENDWDLFRCKTCDELTPVGEVWVEFHK